GAAVTGGRLARAAAADTDETDETERQRADDRCLALTPARLCHPLGIVHGHRDVNYRAPTFSPHHGEPRSTVSDLRTLGVRVRTEGRAEARVELASILRVG